MKRLFFAILFGMLSACPVQAEVDTNNHLTFTAHTDTIWFQYGPSWNPQALSLSQESGDTSYFALYYEYQYDGVPQDWLFFSAGDTLKVGYSELPQAVTLRNAADQHLILIYYISEEKPANFPDSYIENCAKTGSFKIPEVFELANIAIAITDYGMDNPWRVMKDGEYYRRVIDHFGPFKNHPLINEIEFSDDRISDYYSFRDNAICYRFEGDSLRKSGIHSFVRIPDLFGKNLALVQDFATRTNFRQFYKDNQDFYRNQIEHFGISVHLSRMWKWLETRFPNKYDCYRVIFSPLIKASHETSRFKDNEKDYSETIMFVGGPQLFANRYEGNLHSAMLARMIFTEIDHNYVNPVTRRFTEEIERAFQPTDFWQAGSGYNSTWAFFNEYLTWALFVLYARDNYSHDDFSMIKQATSNAMKNRGFIRFPEFMDFILDEYRNGISIPKIYPRVIEWANALNKD